MENEKEILIVKDATYKNPEENSTTAKQAEGRIKRVRTVKQLHQTKQKLKLKTQIKLQE